jgi:hypothetical protein
MNFFLKIVVIAPVDQVNSNSISGDCFNEMNENRVNKGAIVRLESVRLRWCCPLDDSINDETRQRSIGAALIKSTPSTRIHFLCLAFCN